jgi:magnesium transporter
MLFANSGFAPRETLTPGPHLDTDAIWIDLLDPTDDERAAAQRITGLDVPVRDEIAEIESSSRLAFEDGVLTLNTPAAYRDGNGHSMVAPLGFVLSPQRLVTVRFAALPVFDSVAEHFSHLGRPCSSMEIFVILLEGMVDRFADVLERVAVDLEGTSRDIFGGEDGTRRRSSIRADRELRRTLTQIGRAGDAIGNLRDVLLGFGRIVAYVQQVAADWTAPELRTRLQTVKQDIASLNDYDQQLTNKMSFLLDATLGFINIEQNNGVKVLTVVSVVGIPPTFVVGLYGMNFKGMPEYDWAWGYQYGLVLIALSIVVPLVWFKIKGWL